MNNLKDNLSQLKEFLTEDKWCAGYNVIDKHGYGVTPFDPSACKWCLLSATYKLWGDKNNLNIEESPIFSVQNALRLSAISLFDEGSLIFINDELGFQAIHKVINHAIEQCKE